MTGNSSSFGVCNTPSGKGLFAGGRAAPSGNASKIGTQTDVINIMKHPQTMIASDGRLVKFGDGHPHPRWYGTFPRVLGRYVRQKKIISLTEAIHKMTLFQQ